MINVTKTILPNKKIFNALINEIWDRNLLTNGGPCVIELENRLKSLLGVKHLFLVNNGTIAIQIALKALGLKNCDIITTPFSYVATTSSILWEGLNPIFVDIEPNSLTLDPSKIESAITKKTKAILPVHVYGFPCQVEKIQEIANKHNLYVIYDAAHGYGVKLKEQSILKWGNISTLSFHATKLFHTIEGGALITEDDMIAHKISYMRNFGHETQTSFYDIGINGKMNEFCAAMGLSLIDSIPRYIIMRKKISDKYDSLLVKNGIIKRPRIPSNTNYNYSYYPILLPSEEILLRVMLVLQKNQIFPRRYFYPSLNTLSYISSQPMPISEDISAKVLCLPLYPDLKFKEVEFISKLILENI